MRRLYSLFSNPEIISLNRKKIVILVIIMGAVIGLILQIIDLFSYQPLDQTSLCFNQKEEIEQAMVQIQMCKIDQDCQVSPYNCPFQCLAINRHATRSEISALIKRYHKECGICIEECRFSKARCVQNRCILSKD